MEQIEGQDCQRLSGGLAASADENKALVHQAIQRLLLGRQTAFQYFLKNCLARARCAIRGTFSLHDGIDLLANFLWRSAEMHSATRESTYALKLDKEGGRLADANGNGVGEAGQDGSQPWEVAVDNSGLNAGHDGFLPRGAKVGGVDEAKGVAEGIAGDDVQGQGHEGRLQLDGLGSAQQQLGDQPVDAIAHQRLEGGDSALGEEWVEGLAAQAVVGVRHGAESRLAA